MSAGRRTEWWFPPLCLFPLAALTSIYFEAFVARIVLGHWPIPSLNDPKDVASGSLHLITAVFVVSVYPAAVFTVALLLGNWRVVTSLNRSMLWSLLFLLSHVVFQVSARWDPGLVWYWWFD
jgi:hypothetical protein